MKKAGTTCAICGEIRQHGNGWFMLVENRWTDRLKILAWNGTLAGTDGVHSACSTSHVQQLVVHWMTMGSLDFPFADAPVAHAAKKASKARVLDQPVGYASSSRVLGELAVHRESLRRVLSENPESLVGVLEALTSALTNERLPLRTQEEFDEKTEVYAF